MLKTIFVAVLICLSACGCSGLNVQWAASATYNSAAVTSATLTPGAEKPAK